MGSYRKTATRVALPYQLSAFLRLFAARLPIRATLPKLWGFRSCSFPYYFVLICHIRGRFTRETLAFQAFLYVLARSVRLGMLTETPFLENTVIFRTNVE